MKRPLPLQVSLRPLDNRRLANLCGPLDENLRQIDTALGITTQRRGEHFYLHGDEDSTRRGAVALKRFYGEADHPLQVEDIQLGLIEVTRRPLHEAGLSTRDEATAADAPGLMTRKASLHGRTPRQVDYLRTIADNDVTFGIGPAGTGKTYLAVACAVDAFEREHVERIILTRPAVEAGERLGFLPGDLAQKVDPYLRPLYDALYELMGFDRVVKCFERGVIEIAPLAFMRGRTLNRAFIILDEAQNTTPEQMKMFLTRIGIGAKVVVTGDLTQIDLPRGHKSGLAEAMSILSDIQGIGSIKFQKEDVVRHPLVARIVEAYEKHSLPTP